MTSRFIPLILLTAGTALAAPQPQLGRVALDMIDAAMGRGSGHDKDLASSSTLSASSNTTALPSSTASSTVSSTTASSTSSSSSTSTSTSATTSLTSASSSATSTTSVSSTTTASLSRLTASSSTTTAEPASSSNATDSKSTDSKSATKISISSSEDPAACGSISLSVSGGTAPFTIGVFNSSDSTIDWHPVETLSRGNGTELDWNVTYAPDSLLFLGVEDAYGQRAFTSELTVGDSEDLTCLDDSTLNGTKSKSTSGKSKTAASKSISPVAITMIVLAIIVAIILLAIAIWAIRRRKARKFAQAPISFDPQPTNRFEIESDIGDAVEFSNVEVTPYMASPRASMAMAMANHDPITYGMPYPPGNPFSDPSPYDSSPYTIATAYGQPPAYGYARPGVASTRRDTSRLPSLTVVTGATPLSPEIRQRERGHNPFENPLPPLPADSGAQYIHTSQHQGFVPVRSDSVRSDTSNMSNMTNTTHRSSMDRSYPLSAVHEENSADLYHSHMEGIPEQDAYGGTRW